MADVKKVIEDLGNTNWSADEKEAYKALELMKGLISNDDELAKKYLKAVDDYTTQLAKKMLNIQENHVIDSSYKKYFF